MKKLIFSFVISHFVLTSGYAMASLAKKGSPVKQKKTNVTPPSNLLLRRVKKPTVLSAHTGPVKALAIAALVKAEKTNVEQTIVAQLELVRKQMNSEANQKKENKTVIPGPSTPSGSAAAATSSTQTTPLASPLWTQAKGKPKNASPNTNSPTLAAALQDSRSKPVTPRQSPKQHTVHTMPYIPSLNLEALATGTDKKDVGQK